MQTAIQHVHNRQGAPANVTSPTWAVNLAGRRVSPVLHLPRTWRPVSQTHPPPSASFDPTGHLLVLPLVRVGGDGNITAEDLFVADTAARTVRAIPAKPFTLSASRAIPLVGAWDQKGLLWVLATNPDRGYYQLASWTGTGPLHTLAPRQDSPINDVGSWTGLTAGITWCWRRAS